ncbi:aldo-keto reductase family 1 member C23-like [Equus przewalskii]|uniref:Aldo-keto reductase family 1 member C23-like n=1 Tax=Equus przewalskii TaxID=9798 RepID=A0ABM4MZE2_EQUPR
MQDWPSPSVCPTLTAAAGDDSEQAKTQVQACLQPSGMSSLSQPEQTVEFLQVKRADKSFPVLLEDPVLCAMAKMYERTPALIALRYQLQRGVVVLAKSYNEKRIKENIQVFEFQLTSEDMKVLDGLNRNLRYLPLRVAADHPEYPFSDEY